MNTLERVRDLLPLLDPLAAHSKGSPPHCEKLSRVQTIYGLPLPAGTEICRQEGDKYWTWATLPPASLVFPGIPLEPGAAGKVHFSKIAWDGKHLLVEGKLSANANIGGVPFQKGSEVEFYKEFSQDVYYPVRGTLAEKYTVNGASFPPGTVLDWSRDPYRPEALRLAILAEPSVVLGRKLQGNILFHENGQVENFTLAENSRIDGVPCFGTRDPNQSSGGFLDVSFYPSGKLKSGVLSQSHVLASFTYPKESRLDFYETGELRSFLLPHSPNSPSIMIGGVSCDTDSHSFHSSMVPESYVDGYASETEGVKTMFNVLLYKNGKVAYCDIDKDQSFFGIPLSSNSSGFVGVAFYESGKLRRGHLAKDQTISKIQLPAETGIELYESGALKSAEDHDGLTVGDVKYPWGKLISFREDGSVIPQK